MWVCCWISASFAVWVLGSLFHLPLDPAPLNLHPTLYLVLQVLSSGVAAAGFAMLLPPPRWRACGVV